jgi:hypothetical protein
MTETARCKSSPLMFVGVHVAKEWARFVVLMYLAARAPTYHCPEACNAHDATGFFEGALLMR